MIETEEEYDLKLRMISVRTLEDYVQVLAGYVENGEPEKAAFLMGMISRISASAANSIGNRCHPEAFTGRRGNVLGKKVMAEVNDYHGHDYHDIVEEIHEYQQREMSNG